MPMVAPAVLEQIRLASDIVDVIGASLPLKRAGASFTALCPFHKEKTASFHINPQKQLFYCYGCHKGGDVFRFVQDYEGLTFIEAVRRLAERARIPIESETTPQARDFRYVKESLFLIHEQITQHWHRILVDDTRGSGARTYLAQRGVSGESIERFRLGFAPDLWDDTVGWSRGHHHDTKLMEKAGLIIPREGGGGHYDRFRGRLMFPICDEQGRVIGFSGRTLEPEAKTAKYVNSPETPIFFKSRVFYGLDKAKRALLDRHSAIVCEGQLDLIACHQSGIEHVVAPQGTALTSEHVRILKRYVDQVLLCFDSDAAGQSAAIRSMDDLLASEMAVRVISIPTPHDPDSYLRAHGADAFRRLADAAPGFFDFYLRLLCERHGVGNDRGRLAITKAMADSVRKTRNAVLIDTYAQKTAALLGVSIDAVRIEFRRSGRIGHGPVPDMKTEPAGEGSDGGGNEEDYVPPPLHEFWLLKLLLLDDDLVEPAARYLDPAWITHRHLRDVLCRRLASHENHTWNGVAGLLTQVQHPHLQRLISEAASESRQIPNREQQLIDCLTQLRNRHLKREIALRHAGLDPSGGGDATSVLTRINDLRSEMRAPLADRAAGDSARESVETETGSGRD